MKSHPFHYDAVVPPDIEIDQVRATLEARRARRVGEIPRGETELAEEVWEYADGDRIRIVADHFVDTLSLRAESATPGAPAGLIYALRTKLRLQEIDDLVAVSRSEVAAVRSHARRGLAAIVDMFRTDVTEAIAAGLKEPDPAHRDHALRAIARWPHFVFVRDLEEMAKTEPDPGLRKEATRLARDVRKHGRRGTF